ncbi:hypothetical protein NQ318_019106 [Aromia moschata]|uniref:Uncharacterized protein n=1 Tax=Aromia moschata TaxID=1265417 RepID=A0AAV8XQ66_9CUCU|nr:hypothetical protein NQ318_019106 [Aromia moschata]
MMQMINDNTLQKMFYFRMNLHLQFTAICIIIGPFFIDGNLNEETYLALLQNNVVPTMANLYPAEGNPQLPVYTKNKDFPPKLASIVSLLIFSTETGVTVKGGSFFPMWEDIFGFFRPFPRYHPPFSPRDSERSDPVAPLTGVARENTKGLFRRTPGGEFGGRVIGELLKKFRVRNFEKKNPGSKVTPKRTMGPSSKPKRPWAFFSPMPQNGLN